jgi:uncharacterized protein with gpF-like domain
MTLNEFALHYDRFVRRYERKYQRLIAAEIKKQLLTYVNSQDISSVNSEGVQKLITKLHEEVGIKWARETQKYTRTLKTRDRFSDYMYSLLRTYMIMDALNAGEKITETTIEHIKDLLYQATILNWSLMFLNRELMNIKYIRMRAKLIAMTEIAYAANLGGYVLMNGQNVKKRWVGILDNKIRRDHRILNGQVKNLMEPFEVVNKLGVKVQMMYPGDRSMGAGADQICNCRCFVVYE